MKCFAIEPENTTQLSTQYCRWGRNGRRSGEGKPRFQRIKAPDKGELEGLAHLISQRVGRCLERQGLLEQNPDRAWLELKPAEDKDAVRQILGSSASYRIAVSAQ